MIDISILRAMVAAGAPVEAILAAVEADQLAEGERVQARRAKDAERQRRKRHADTAESRTVTRSHSDADASLSSLLSSSVSTTKQQESKEEKKKERARKSLLPDDWAPKPRHYEKAKKFGHPDGFVDRKADAMRSWAASKAIMRASWDATFDGFIEPKEGHNGSRNSTGRTDSTAGPDARPDAIVAGVGGAFARRFSNQHAGQHGNGVSRNPDAAAKPLAEPGAAGGDRRAPTQLELVAEPDAGKRRELGDAIR